MKSERRRFAISDLQKFAEEKGGLCRSISYIRASDKFKWTCKQGHEFEMRWDTLTRFSSEKEWCSQCRAPSLEVLQSYAQKNGGELISPKFIRAKDHYEWRCSMGHVWKAIWFNIKAGGWCPRCPRNKYSIVDLQKYASSKGGKCLSYTYDGYHEHHLWECSKEHIWKATWTNIKDGKTWCSECHKEKYNIENLKNLASTRGGYCLSEEYIDAQEKYIWKCSEGHTWEAQWYNIQNGTWCSKCRKLSLEIAQETAEEKGGVCLSSEYINDKTNMLWECVNGHIWESTLNSIRQQNVWCIICKGKKLELKIAQNIADERGGKCLSKKYINCDALLKWMCEKEHIWQATIASVKHSNRWCPKCWRLSIQPTVEQLSKIAQIRGGNLLSTKYKNNTTKMKWKCKQGHIWKSTSASVKNQGSWCPNCLYKSENMCREILEDIFFYLPDSSFPKCRPQFLQIGKQCNSCLELDGYNSSLSLAFEYQGLQHYKYIPFFHRTGEMDLKELQQRDVLKRERCAKAGVTLIEIPYMYTYEDPEELRKYIQEQILIWKKTIEN